MNNVPNKISEEQLAALKTANPRGIVKRLVGPEAAEDADCDDFIFRVPNRGDYNSYKVHQKKSLLGQAAPDATASLARLCLLFPTKDEFDALLEKAPAIVEDLGEDLVEAAACGLSVREGKP